MTSLIFGYGMTGQSFDRYLTKNGVKFDIYDVKHVDHPNAFSKLPSKEKLQSYEMVYISPGINILGSDACCPHSSPKRALIGPKIRQLF